MQIPDVEVEMQDKRIICQDCGKEFTWTVGEQEFFKAKGFENQPKHCPECRKARRRRRAGEAG